MDPHEIDLTLAKLREAADLYRQLAHARREQAEGRRRARDLAAADREFLQDESAAALELRRRRQEARRLEDELQTLENRLADRRARPASDPATVLALADELRTLESRRQELERRLLETWQEAGDPAAPAVGAEWSREEAASRRQQQEERALKAGRAIAEVESELAHHLTRLPTRVGRKVAQIARRHPDPVADLVEGSCGGCGQSLPPQEAVDADRERALIVCQGCGRFVVARSSRRTRGWG